MSCRRFELLLPASVDRRVDAGQQHEVDEHVARCANCAAELDAMQGARDTLAACGPAEPPADLAARISASVRIAVQQSETGSFWDRFIAVAWPAAAGATVAAVILFALTLRGTAGPAPSNAAAPPSADPVEQVSSSDRSSDVQMASNVLGMELD